METPSFSDIFLEMTTLSGNDAQKQPKERMASPKVKKTSSPEKKKKKSNENKNGDIKELQPSPSESAISSPVKLPSQENQKVPTATDITQKEVNRQHVSSTSITDTKQAYESEQESEQVPGATPNIANKITDAQQRQQGQNNKDRTEQADDLPTACHAKKFMHKKTGFGNKKRKLSSEKENNASDNDALIQRGQVKCNCGKYVCMTVQIF